MANKRQRKKRMKKMAQMKLIEATPAIEATPVATPEILKDEVLKDKDKSWLNPAIVEEAEPAKEYKAHLLYEGKYEVENQAYQKQLDIVYDGAVTPIEKYVNPAAIITHHCRDCDHTFYAKPLWLLNKANQQHVCGVNTVISKNTKRRKLTNDDILEMIQLHKQGISKSKIALKLGISRPTVINHLKKAGIS